MTEHVHELSGGAGMSTTALDVVVDLEREFPVDQWVVSDIHVWPLLRIHIFNQLVFHFIGAGAKESGRRGPIGRAIQAAGALGRIGWNMIADPRKNAWPGADVEAMMLGDGVSLSKVDGEWQDRVMDPIIAALAADGRHALLMTPMNMRAVPRRTPSLYVQPMLDAAKGVATAWAKVSPLPHKLDGLSEMLERLRKVYPDIAFPGESWLLAQTARVRHMARIHEKLIRRTRARAAFVNTYYSAEGMAFVHAARQAGCITVDVQHGNQGGNSAYERWTKVPADGYGLLPHLFWCWSDDEVRAINNQPWSIAAHRAVNVGNLWTQTWSDPGNELVRRYAEKLAELKRKAAARHHFLLTPSWGHPDHVVDTLIEAVRLGQQGIHWWLRLHPTRMADREAMRARFAQLNVRNVEIDAATDFPLPLLLSEMDVNITMDSSTVLDAAVAGIPSVLSTSLGATIFSARIERGHARFAEAPPAIVEAALDLARSNPLAGGASAPAATGVTPLRVALAEIFERASRSEEPRPVQG